MRVYLYANPDTRVRRDRLKSMVATLVDAGLTVLSNHRLAGTADPSADAGRPEQGDAVVLERIEGLVIEGSVPDAQTGYLVALALAHKKPVLYLVPEGRHVDPHLTRLAKGRGISPLLGIVRYRERDLAGTLQDFVGRVERGSGREVPNVKFTLRITPRLERFLAWKTKGGKRSKADWVREQLQRIMDADGDFKG